MQWNCPHCGTILAIAEDTLGKGWSFSRCYKCGGFALIRRAEINIIKVDKAPPGENVILPEAPGTASSALMSETASINYVKHALNKPKKNEEPTSETPIPNLVEKKSSPPSLDKLSPLAPAASGNVIFPEPLPEIESEPDPVRTLPIGIAAAAVLAIASGIYFFLQWQSLGQRAREAAATAAHQKQAKASAAQVRSEEGSQTASSDVIAPPPLSGPTQGQEVSVNTRRSNTPVVTDRVQQTATAPIKPPTDANFMVRIKARRVSVHVGPGMEFLVTGTVNLNEKYPVSDLHDRWLKLPVGWVRNDLVQLITTPKVDSLRP